MSFGDVLGKVRKHLARRRCFVAFGSSVEKLWILKVFMSYKNLKITFVYILVIGMNYGTLVFMKNPTSPGTKKRMTFFFA